jgi:hypothetical protein
MHRQAGTELSVTRRVICAVDLLCRLEGEPSICIGRGAVA